MSTLLDAPSLQSPETAAERLRSSMAAARLSFTWLGIRKSLSSTQKDQAANSFGAEGKFLSAGKKLLDTSHPAFKAVTAIRGRTLAYWRSISLPFPEAGIRLIRQDKVDEFSRRMREFQNELESAVEDLSLHYASLRSAARERLGDLFNPSDYPPTLAGQFGIEHDFPSVEPPPYLQQLSPQLYQQECQRMQSRFDEAVQLAEQAFLEELARLVEHLTERLSGTDDGKPKVFRDSAISNLTEFFERFRQLNVRSNPELDELVASAQRVVRGLEPQRLRDSSSLRQQVTTQMAAVQADLDQLLVERPRRNIQRRPR
jgi:hypothetical protein